MPTCQIRLTIYLFIYPVFLEACTSDFADVHEETLRNSKRN